MKKVIIFQKNTIYNKSTVLGYDYYDWQYIKSAYSLANKHNIKICKIKMSEYPHTCNSKIKISYKNIQDFDSFFIDFLSNMGDNMTGIKIKTRIF